MEKTAKKRKREQTARRKSEGRAPVWATVSALFSLIGIFGLFIGYYTGHSPVGYALAGGEPILRGSFLGIALEIVRGSISMPQPDVAAGLAQLFPLVLYCAFLFLLASLFLSFPMTIAAILLPRSSRKLCLRNGKLLLLSYSALFLGNFIYRALTSETIGAEFFDVPGGITAGLLSAVFFFVSLAESGGKGAANFLLLLLSLGMLLGLVLPGSPLSKDVNDFVFSNGAHGGTARLTLILLCGATVVNVLLSFLRLNVRRGSFFDFLRFGGQIACETLFLMEYGTVYGSVANFITAQPLSAALLLSCSALALFLPPLFAALSKKARTQKDGQRETKPDAARQENPEKERRAAAPGFDEQPSSRGAV